MRARVRDDVEEDIAFCYIAFLHFIALYWLVLWRIASDLNCLLEWERRRRRTFDCIGDCIIPVYKLLAKKRRRALH